MLLQNPFLSKSRVLGGGKNVNVKVISYAERADDVNVLDRLEVCASASYSILYARHFTIPQTIELNRLFNK